jgi:hypothetical protein
MRISSAPLDWRAGALASASARSWHGRTLGGSGAIHFRVDLGTTATRSRRGRSRIPRWFSGIVGVEECRPTGADRALVSGWRSSRTSCCRQPTPPTASCPISGEINHAYYRRRSVEMVVATRVSGDPGDPRRLSRWRDYRDVFGKALGASPEEFDKEFDTGSQVRRQATRRDRRWRGGRPFQREMTAAGLHGGQQGRGEAVRQARDLLLSTEEDSPTRVCRPRNGATPCRGGAVTGHGARRDQYDANGAAAAGKAGDQRRHGGAGAGRVDGIRDQSLHQKLEMRGARAGAAARERAARRSTRWTGGSVIIGVAESVAKSRAARGVEGAGNRAELREGTAGARVPKMDTTIDTSRY